MTCEENEVLNRWKSRALRAEMKLFRAGLSDYNPSELWPDDEWINVTLEHKDGSPVHVDELTVARESMRQRGRL